MESVCNDNSLGPIVLSGCRGGFDFTLLFENFILTILPCSLAIAFSLARLIYLRKSPRKVVDKASFLKKTVIILLLAFCQLALLITWVFQHPIHSRAVIPAAAIEFVATIILILVSHAEHLKSVRPSTLLCLYLPLVIVLDIARDRTLWLMHLWVPITPLFTACVALKIIWLSLEVREKRDIISEKYSQINGEELAGILKRSVFGWLLPFVIYGSRKEFAVRDLIDLDNELHSRKVHGAFQEEWNRVDPQKSHQLALSLLKTFKWKLLGGVFPRLGLLVFTIFQPIIIEKLVDYVGANNLPLGEATGLGLIGAVAVVYGGSALCTAVYYHTMYRLVAMIRGTLISAIYQAALASHASTGDASSSLTLISADCDTIVLGLVDFHELWASFVQIGLIMWLLARQVQWGAVAPLALSFACVLASALLFSRLSRYQKQWNEAIQIRLAATADMLVQMREVKFLGFTGFFTTFIQGLRVKELDVSTRLRQLLVWIITISLIPMTLAPVITFIIYAAPQSGGGSFLPSRAFSSLTMLSLLSQPINLLVQTAPGFAGALSCMDRIQKFLTANNGFNREMSSRQKNFPRQQIELQSLKSPPVNVRQTSDCALNLNKASMGWKEDTPLLRDLCLTVSRGQSVAVFGPVSCGKTTLLKGILGETTWSAGLVDLNGSSVTYCDQTPWIMNDTIKQNILGNTDPDPRRYKRIIEACQLDVDFANMSHGEHTVVGSNGMKLSHGQKQRISLARAIMKKSDLSLIDNVLSGLDARTKANVFDQVFGPHGVLKQDGTSFLLVTHERPFLSYFDHVMFLDSESTIVHQGPVENDQITKRSTDTMHDNSRPSESLTVAPNIPGQGLSLSSPARQTGDWSLYKDYASAAGKWNTLFYLIVTSALAVVYNFSSLWLDWWSSANSGGTHLTTVKYLTVYAFLGGITLALICVASWQLIVRMVSKSALYFHSVVLTTAMRAPLSFFACTDTGVMMNRFSEDMQLFDMGLPMAALNTTIFSGISLVQLVIVCASTRWMAIMIPVLIVVLYLLQNIYLRTSRQVRLMDIELRAPLYSQFLETLSGLITIRCLQWEEKFSAHHERLLDTSQRAVYMLYTIQRWLNLVLDLIVMGLAVLLAILAVTLHGKISAGSVGLAITNITAFNYNLVSVIQAWTKVEMSLGALVRTRDFIRNTPVEPGVDNKVDLPPEWPQRGEIKIQDLVASHGPDTPIILKGVSLSIKPGQKIGICGRTGSGKSSLIFCLCRGMQIHSGHILIDGIDLATVPPEEIRTRVNTITQDALLIKGSVRLNLDLSQSQTDVDLLSVCRIVGLEEYIQANGGLDAEITSLALSPGQKQLFCLARSLLRPAQILILDEVTSNVDYETDLKMREIIEREFPSQTVIAIAHRLDSILQSDLVVVLDKGELVEMDSPEALLSRPSQFSRLVHLSRDS